MLWIVKIGGSLAKTSALKSWLYSLAKLSEVDHIKIVIVPGGGPFADAVREIQSHWKFNDTIAHHMALLAMEQYGLMMKGICPQIELAGDLASIKGLLETNHICIWLPYQMTGNEKTIPESWNITSDSLSAWLANLLPTDKLILIKSAKHDKEMTLNAITDSGLVDPLFFKIVQQDKYETYLLYKNDFDSIKSFSHQPLQ